MKPYEILLKDNKTWAAKKQEEEPDFFEKLLNLQTPEFLWIGCSDSRVPANQITSTQPGEIFVHRNIANMVVHTDTNLLSVLEYAVTHLEVKHIIVCGHYGCGGIKAAMSNKDYNQVLNMWLRNIKDVYRINFTELENIEDEELKLNRLTELNVMEQVSHLAETAIVQRAWKKREGPDLHGWVYGLKDGIINPVFEMKANSAIDPLYQYHDLE